MSESQLQLQQLKGWLAQSSIKCNCLPAKVQYGNGLVFNDESNDTLISVPSDMIVHAPNIVRWAVENEEKHFLLNWFLHRNDLGQETKDIELTERKIISRWLLYQILLIRAGMPDLKFAAWIRSLPPSRDINLPITWDDTDVESLNGSSIYEAVASKKNHLKKTYTKFFEDPKLRVAISEFVKSGSREEIPEVELEITIHDWLLVDEWISSRALSLPDNEDNMMTVMVPIVDLANHDKVPNAVYIANSEGGVDLITLKHCPGEEITINYGPESGAGEFLFKYGFIPDYMKTARSMKVYNDPMDSTFRKCVDEEHDPSYKVDEDSSEIDPESSYEILFTILSQVFQQPHSTIFTDNNNIGKGKPTWHDTFITLHCCGSDLEVVYKPEEEYLALHFKGEPIDITDLENGFVERDAEFFNNVVKPRGNKAIVNIINNLLLNDHIDTNKAHKLVSLERDLLKAVISEAQQNMRDD